jgi:hypothetical protein
MTPRESEIGWLRRAIERRHTQLRQEADLERRRVLGQQIRGIEEQLLCLEGGAGAREQPGPPRWTPS